MKIALDDRFGRISMVGEVTGFCGYHKGAVRDM